ncbi:N-acetylmuramic acid 6-phosphate etherase [Soehngenia saccharolytica]|nr:N-acetylmuramic acid 6-phosphate etherase [Soehngenia saccharolytica]
MTNIEKLTTEARNPKTYNLDEMSPLEIVRVMNEEDENVVKAVRDELENIAKAIETCTKALENGGRLIYMGAGTSGRLGLLDAVECPPTFGTPDDLVIGLIAGGEKAFIKAVEGAEDSTTLGEEDLKSIGVNSKDVVVGIAASGRTPYVIFGLKYAKSIGAHTIAIACNKDSEVGKEADLAIEVVTGPEVLTGSTRLKAGTAQKMVLNMISTGTMVGIGKVYQNLMVDVVQTNEKLKIRAENIVISATNCTREEAKKYLDLANGNAKTAIVMILKGCTFEEATDRLLKSKGHIRLALLN